MDRFSGKIVWMAAIFLFIASCLLGVSEKLEAQEAGYSDGMETTEGWMIGGESGTNSNLGTVSGKIGRAIEISYEFVSGSWIQVQKDVAPLNIGDAEQLKFYYKGNGAINTLQVKLEDVDGSTFGINLEGATNTEGLWKQMTVLIDELTYFWGGDEDLDIANIKKIYFAITKEEGGTGVVVIDEVQFLGY